MHDLAGQQIVFIVLTVVLFITVGVVFLILIDHKSKIPGHFQTDSFSISGMRRDHPLVAFVVTISLVVIIFSLLLELLMVLGEHVGVFGRAEEKPEILKQISQHRYSESQKHFHNVFPSDEINLGSKPVCFQCHGDYPHSKKRMIRTLLNMHTQFIGCMTCHTDAKKIPEDQYKFSWLNYSGIEVTGVPFGTDVMSDTGYLVETDDYYSKIVIYDTDISPENLIEITEDKQDVQEFLQIKDTLSDQDKESIKKRFHKQITSKGRTCKRCHTDEKKSFIPLRQLGFSNQRVLDITNLNIVGIVDKYEDFFMPNLFDTKKSSSKSVNDKKIEASDDKSPKGKAWWQRSNESDKTKGK